MSMFLIMVYQLQRLRRAVSSRVNSRMLGWARGNVPAGSRVISPQNIQVGTHFDAFGPVWIEAVTAFAGESFAPRIVIGDRFSASSGLHISAILDVAIGDDVLVGSNVYIADHSHGNYAGQDCASPNTPPRSRPLRGGGGVRIGDRVWLGDNVVILEGVVVGDGSVVGANSVVTRSLPSETICVGAPARPVKKYCHVSQTWIPWTE